MASERSREREREEEKKAKERGAKDDWEALKMVLEGLPNLRQRVLRRIQELKNRKRGDGVQISAQDQQDYKREANRKAKEKK